MGDAKTGSVLREKQNQIPGDGTHVRILLLAAFELLE